MLDQVLQILAELTENPAPILQEPEDERFLIENALYDLAELIEAARCGVLVKP